MAKGEPIVVVKEVGKNYGTVEALKDVSFVVERGEIFGLIGPDGAGKSSLFRILTTLLLADKGTAMVAGLDVVTDYKQIRTKVGYMPGRFSLYQDLSVEENLEFFATVFHTTVQENYDLIKDIYQQIEPFRKRRAGALSGGMKQKLALSCALIHKPDILFLDEPTTGVDPVSRKEFWQMLRNLREQGITIVVSTPIMDEARQCDRIAFINHGQIHGIDTPERILHQFASILCPPSLEREEVKHEVAPVIEVEQLTKCFGDFTAVDHISFLVNRGEIFGFLGANGAGKSTMINLITDNVSRDKMNGGSILFGEDSAEEDILKLGKQFRGLVGYMPQQQGFYEDFSPKAFLKYMAEIKGVKKIKTTDDNGNEVVKTVNQQIDELLEVVNLTKVAYKKIGGFSGGMKQRVLLAQALLGNPKILILDEPTAGLDPKERISIRNYIAELSKDKIILFATHVVSDIECIADKVLLLKSGEIIATGTPVELIESMAGKVGEITCTLDEVGELQKEYKIGNIRQRKNGLALRVVGDELPEEAVKVGDNIDLEDVYLYYFE